MNKYSAKSLISLPQKYNFFLIISAFYFLFLLYLSLCSYKSTNKNRNSIKKELLLCRLLRKFMNYLEFRFFFEGDKGLASDILPTELAEIGFESFVLDENSLLAYIREIDCDEMRLKKTLDTFPLPDVRIAYSSTLIEDKDWNSEWEKNYFQPIVIEGKCIIRSSFHLVKESALFGIIIDPKMAFGTGHHETTRLMIEELLELPLQEKSLLDMGCGTAVLAILASMRGAKKLLAVDIDNWAYENALENLSLNGISNIEVIKGGAETLAGEQFDVILANINRNILLEDMSSYCEALNPGGQLFISGFYTCDIPLLREKAASLGLAFVYHKECNDWALVRFEKLD